MAARKLQIMDAFQFGRQRLLRPGDRFRVTGGPYYVTDNGENIPMYERGVFVFEHYCVQGAAKWIDAYRDDGGGRVFLWVGRPCWSNVIPNLRRQPYRVTRKLGRQKSGQTKVKRLRK
jgi:hypothetical protein